jgi:hypothetical protein
VAVGHVAASKYNLTLLHKGRNKTDTPTLSRMCLPENMEFMGRLGVCL